MGVPQAVRHLTHSQIDSDTARKLARLFRGQSLQEAGKESPVFVSPQARIRALYPAAFGFSLLLFVAGSALADATYIARFTSHPPVFESSHNRTSEKSDNSDSTEIRILVKGKKVREELPNGHYLIFDGHDNVISVDSVVKSYSLSKVKELTDQKSMLPSRIADRIKVNSSAELTKSDDAKDIAGEKASRYFLTENVDLTTQRPSGYGGGGGRFPGGGFPRGGGGRRRGGGGGYPAPSEDRRPALDVELPSLRVDGEIWAAPSTTSLDAATLLTPILKIAAPHPIFMKPLEEKLSHLKAVPISSHFSVTAPKGEVPAGVPLELSLEVTSVSHGSVDESLFSVPEGYTKVAPEPAPSIVRDRR